MLPAPGATSRRDCRRRLQRLDATGGLSRRLQAPGMNSEEVPIMRPSTTEPARSATDVGLNPQPQRPWLLMALTSDKTLPSASASGSPSSLWVFLTRPARFRFPLLRPAGLDLEGRQHWLRAFNRTARAESSFTSGWGNELWGVGGARFTAEKSVAAILGRGVAHSGYPIFIWLAVCSGSDRGERRRPARRVPRTRSAGAS